MAKTKKTAPKSGKDSKADAKTSTPTTELVKRTEHFRVPFGKLKLIEGFNERTDYGDIDELKTSIIKNGVRKPMHGYQQNGLFYITDGHRRYMAMEMAIKEGHNIEPVAFFLEGKDRTEEQRVLDMLILNEGKDLDLLEKGRAYKKLEDSGWSQTTIAETLGKSIAHVNSCITIAKSGKAVQKAVEEKEISPSTALEISRAGETDEEQEQVLETMRTQSVKKPKAKSEKKTQKGPVEKSADETRDEIDEALAQGKVEKKAPIGGVKDVKKIAGKGKKNPLDRLKDLHEELAERKAEGRCVIEDRMELLWNLIMLAEDSLTDEQAIELHSTFTCPD